MDDNNLTVGDDNSPNGEDKSHPDGQFPYSESASEYNTADLSNISGLSKILRADDSIADKVRCLLEEDEDYAQQQKPALLDNSDSNSHMSAEMRGRMMELFQDKIEGKIIVDDKDENIVAPPPQAERESPNGSIGASDSIPAFIQCLDKRDEASDTSVRSLENTERENYSSREKTSEKQSQKLPQPNSNGMKSTPAYRESIDDMMNLSDSTEYSDLPKIVDNPMKNISIREKSTSEIPADLTMENSSRIQQNSNGLSSSSVPVASTQSPVKISGKLRFYVESDPNTPHCSDDSEKLTHLEKYMEHQDPEARPEDHSGSYRSGVPSSKPVNRLLAGTGPIHSTPYDPNIQPLKRPITRKIEEEFGHGSIPTVAPTKTDEERRPSPAIPAWEERRSSDHNITLRSRGSDPNGRVSLMSQSLISDKDEEDLHASLKDEDILEKVKKVVSDQDDPIHPSSRLKGPHTVSEVSIASTVDSLAMQVKNLLKEEENIQHQMTSTEAPATNAHDITQSSNFSEEIMNFEKTNLWRYAQQFMPGALPTTSSRHPNSYPAVDTSLNRSNSDLSSINTSILRKIRESMRASNNSLDTPVSSHSISRNGLRTTPNASMNSEFRKEYKIEQSPLAARDTSRKLNPLSGQRAAYQGDSPTVSAPYRSYPPNFTPTAPPSHIVGRYDKHDKSSTNVTAQNESYKPLMAEYSPSPRTQYSFVTPRRVGPSDFKPSPASSMKYTTPETGLHLTNIPLSNETYAATPHIKDSAYFQKIPDPSLLQISSSTPQKPTLESPAVPKQFLNQSPVVGDRKNLRSSSSSDSERMQAKLNDDHLFVKPLINPYRKKKETNKQPNGVRFKTPVEQRYLPSSNYTSTAPLSSSPKSVRFKEDYHPSSRYMASSSSPLGPEYSFSTPRLSCRPLNRSITPKVARDKPRPAKSLPTYDQLVAEQKKSKEEEKEHISPPKHHSSVENSLLFDRRTENSSIGNLTESPGLKVRDTQPEETNRDTTSSVSVKPSVASSSGHNESVATEFSSLKPEICFDDSYQDMTIQSSDEIPLNEDVSDSVQKIGNYPTGPSSLSSSDTELHRRTVSPLEPRIQEYKSSEKMTVDSDSRHATYGGSSNLPLSQSVETRDTATSPVPTLMEPEPAPLPYVRLSKKKPTTLPPRHSISTEKVQNLLMKEKSVGQQPTKRKDVGVGVSTPGTVGESSSDEDLLNLLETFSTKAPMMEKLLRKLYERSLEKKRKIKSDLQEKPPQTMNVTRSVQTSSPKPLAVLKSASTNIPSPRRPDSKRSKRLFVETSSQTSFMKPDRREEQVRYPSHVQKPSKKSEGIQCERNDESIIPYAEKGTSTHELNEKDISNDLKENKENRRKKKTYAFYVDVTPEKPKELEEEKPNIKDLHPVAWYEPYEYVPPWKLNTNTKKRDRREMGFVSVNVQDAFLNHKRDFVLRSWERQEDIAIRAEERKLKDLEKKIQRQIMDLHREKAENIPQTLDKPEHDTMDPTSVRERGKLGREYSWREMKMASKFKYENLPEVVARKRDQERRRFYEANRKRALQYKERILKLVVQKQKTKQAVQSR